MTPERLASRIRLQLEGGSPGLEARSLAGEYSALCVRARERLEQCATLIRLGDEHAAFQSAEAEPDLLGLCAALSFSESEKWHSFCREHGLPAGFPLDDIQVLAVDSLYGKAIGEGHPLYKDYREAMRARDERKALEVLRSISRINPDDPNAQKELARLSSKFLRTSLTKVHELFTEGRAQDAASLMGEMERFGTAQLDEDPRWAEALRLRQAWLREVAAGQLSEIQDAIRRTRKAGDWESCAAEISRLRTLQRDHRIAQDDPEGLAETEEWARGLAAKASSEAATAAAAASLEEELVSLRSECAAKKANASTLARLSSWLERSEEHESRLPEGLRREARSLRQRARAALSRRYTLMLSGWVTALLVAGAVAVWWNQRQSSLRRNEESLGGLRALIERWDHQPALNAVDTLADSKALPAEQAASLRAEIEENRRKEARLREDAAYLNEARKAGVKAADAVKISKRTNGYVSALESAGQTARESLDKAFPNPGSLLAECARALDQARADLATEAAALKAAMGEGEEIANAPAALTALDRMTSLVRLLTDAGDSGMDALAAVADRASARLADERRKAALRRALDDAPDLRSYLAALSQASAASDPQSDTRRRASTVLDRSPSLRELPRAALAPRVGQMWDAVPGSDPQGLFLPAKLTEAELGLLRKVADDSSTRKLRRFSLTEISSRGRRTLRQLIIVGEVTTVRNSLNGGTEFVDTADELTPEGALVRGVWKRREFDPDIKSGEFLIDLGSVSEPSTARPFTRLFDEAGNPSMPLLRALDMVRRAEKLPLEYRAWQSQELFRAAMLRPADWGMTFSPTAQRDALQLRRITQEAMGQHDFLFREKWAGSYNELTLALLPRTATGYAAEARFWRLLLAALRSQQPVFAGYVASDGKPALRDGASDRPLYGLDSEGMPALLFRTGTGGEFEKVTDPAAYSPLLRMPRTVQETAKDVGMEGVQEPPGGWESIMQGRDI